MNEPWKGFVFLDVNDDLLQGTHDLGHGLILRRASINEINDREIESAFRAWSERRGTSRWPNQRMPLVNGNEPQGAMLTNPESWRHAVIECSNKDTFYWNVNLAFSVSDSDLRMGFIRYTNGGGSNPFLEFPMLNVRSPFGAMFVDHELPSLSCLPEIRQNISYVISNINREFPSEIRQILHMFSSLDNLPDSSTLKVLGYFSIIEGLLSHKPSDNDRVDSIQRQLIRNINLLNNRLKKIHKEIAFSDFGETNPETVLRKLYAYRSAIAHGGQVSDPLNKIGEMRIGNNNTDHLWVHDWLRSLTKRLLLSAIVEPGLVMDLK